MNLEPKIGPATAGNANSDFVVPSNEARRLLYAQLILTTDATVANRRAIMQIYDDNSNLIIDAHAGAVVAASQASQHHEFMQGVYRETTFQGSSLQIPMPSDCYLSAGWTLRFNISAGVAGDSFSVNLAWERYKNGVS